MVEEGQTEEKISVLGARQMEAQPTYFRSDVEGSVRFGGVGTGWWAQHIPVFYTKYEGNSAQRVCNLIFHLPHIDLVQLVFRHALQVIFTR